MEEGWLVLLKGVWIYNSVLSGAKKTKEGQGAGSPKHAMVEQGNIQGLPNDHHDVVCNGEVMHFSGTLLSLNPPQDTLQPQAVPHWISKALLDV